MCVTCCQSPDRQSSLSGHHSNHAAMQVGVGFARRLSTVNNLAARSIIGEHSVDCRSTIGQRPTDAQSDHQFGRSGFGWRWVTRVAYLCSHLSGKVWDPSWTEADLLQQCSGGVKPVIGFLDSGSGVRVRGEGSTDGRREGRGKGNVDGRTPGRGEGRGGWWVCVCVCGGGGGGVEDEKRELPPPPPPPLPPSLSEVLATMLDLLSLRLQHR